MVIYYIYLKLSLRQFMYIPNTILFCASMNAITIILANIYVFKVMLFLFFFFCYWLRACVFYNALHIVKLISICFAFLE